MGKAIKKAQEIAAEKPKWGEFKKQLEIVGGSVVDTDTGEIVEAVTVVVNPDTFSVDV